MRKAVVGLLIALLALPAWGVGAGASAIAPVQMFAGGGTFVSNGVFFPGTGVFDGTTLQGMPLKVAKGQDIELMNLDYGDLANCHQLTSFKRKRGRPLFSSKRICAPGESALVLTSQLKPGRYEAYCPVHTTMYAIIEVAAS